MKSMAADALSKLFERKIEGFVAYCTSASSTKTMIFLHKLRNVG